MNTDFLLKFRTRSQVRMSAAEKEKFNSAVGYTEDLTQKELLDIYESVHAFYDIEMDEMEEDEADEMMPTYQLVMSYMRKYWFHQKY